MSNANDKTTFLLKLMKISFPHNAFKPCSMVYSPFYYTLIHIVASYTSTMADAVMPPSKILSFLSPLKNTCLFTSFHSTAVCKTVVSVIFCPILLSVPICACHYFAPCQLAKI